LIQKYNKKWTTLSKCTKKQGGLRSWINIDNKRQRKKKLRERAMVKIGLGIENQTSTKEDGWTRVTFEWYSVEHHLISRANFKEVTQKASHKFNCILNKTVIDFDDLYNYCLLLVTS
jgi:hypothetical protein